MPVRPHPLLPRTRRTAWAAAAALVLLVYVVGVVSVDLTPPGGEVALWWPASGLAAALLLAAPRRWLPAVVLAVTAAGAASNLTAGRPADVAALFGVAVGLEAAVLAVVARRGAAPVSQSADTFGRLVVGGVAGSLVAGAWASTVVATQEGGPFWATLLHVVPSHASAILVLAPVAVALVDDADRPDRREVAVNVLILLGVGVAALVPGSNPATALFVLPVLVWSALRLGLLVLALELTTITVTVMVFASQGGGPLYTITGLGLGVAEAATAQQFFVACVALTLVALATATHQRARLLRQAQADEARFRRSFTDSMVGLLILRSADSGALCVEEANPMAAVVLRRPPEDLVGTALDELVADGPRVPDVEAALAEDGGLRVRTSLVEDADSRLVLSISTPTTPATAPGAEPGAPYASDRGGGRVYTAQVIDFTAEHVARSFLEAERRLTRATLDTTPALIILADADGVILRVNDATCRATGFAELDLIGRPMWRTTTGQQPRDALDDLDTPLLVAPVGSRLPRSTEAEVHTADGGRRRILWDSDFVRDDDDAPTLLVLSGLDVTDQRTTERMIDGLLDAVTTTAIVAADPRGTVTVVNPGAEALFGLTRETAAGRPLLELLPADQRAAWEERFGVPCTLPGLVDVTSGSARPTDETLGPWEWQVTASPGAPGRDVSLTVTAIRDADGTLEGYLCLGHDVTDERRTRLVALEALEREREAVEQLRRLDRARTEFVATASHELRTPVTSIVGYAELLQDGAFGDPDEVLAPVYAAVARNGNRLLELTNDLLTLSSLESGVTVTHRQPLELSGLLVEVEEMVRGRLLDRELDLVFTRPDVPAVVDADRGQLVRVLANLVGNAVKFTEDGGRVVCALDVEGSEAVLRVSDTGIGIPDAEQGELFQKFFRSSTAQDRAIQGTGLGLSIVRQIVEAHEGSVEVVSEHLVGSTFTVRLPLFGG